jgi:hypothetical protein
MNNRAALALAASITVLGWPLRAAAQSPFQIATDAFRYCTMTQPCNWSSHALIAFSATHALKYLQVPLPVAAGTAALFYVGKEVRDHLKWGVLGSADSNGDMVSGCAGALIAYLIARRSLDQAYVAVEFSERTWVTVRLRGPLLR